LLNLRIIDSDSFLSKFVIQKYNTLLVKSSGLFNLFSKVKKIIDLRSDTVTKPSEGMRLAMAQAEVGDDVFSEDPTVLKLQEEVAELLGKEAALFTPTGCMANQLALAVHTTTGDEVIIEADAHIFNYETTAASYLSRVQLYPVKASNRGILTTEEIAPAFRERAYYMPVTRLLALENTHNRAGGSVYPIESVEALTQYAKQQGTFTHLDGARLWNACAETGLAPIEYAQYFDTVAVCFSKGLGAPVGSAICGQKEKIDSARRFRKMWGGGMRQAGVIAAGALYALRNNRDRLKEDHIKAKRFAEIIMNGTTSIKIDLTRVETNIILLELASKFSLEEFLEKIAVQGVRLSRGAGTMIRAVTHMDVSLADCEEAAQTIVKIANA